MSGAGREDLTRAVVDHLEESKDCTRALPFLTHFRNRDDNKHGNSFLHEALAWNRRYAADHLIALAGERDPASFSIHDNFASSYSTPLILASKTADNHSAFFMIGLCGEARDVLNHQDYMGNTALHYACLMRNDPLIEALLLRGCDANYRNDLGYSAYECYTMPVTEEGLAYRYGVSAGHPYLMKHVCDWDRSYQGTHHPSFSNYRWFLSHITLNLDLNFEPRDLDKTKSQLFVFNYEKGIAKRDYTGLTGREILQDHIKRRLPVMDLRIYQGMVAAFLDYRARSFSAERSMQLKSAMCTPDRSYDRMEPLVRSDSLPFMGEVTRPELSVDIAGESVDGLFNWSYF